MLIGRLNKASGARSLLGLPDLAIVLIGLAAIIGHDFPVFLRGHGGKGIATSLGVITALLPFVGYPRTLNGLAAINDQASAQD